MAAPLFLLQPVYQLTICRLLQLRRLVLQTFACKSCYVAGQYRQRIYVSMGEGKYQYSRRQPYFVCSYCYRKLQSDCNQNFHRLQQNFHCGKCGKNAPAATITPSGSLNLCIVSSVTLQANAGIGFTYQWKKGSNNIAGATSQSFTATTAGNYKVIVSYGLCSTTSAVANVTKNCKEGDVMNPENTPQLNLYPNPTGGNFVIEMDLGNEENSEAEIKIFNMLGQQVSFIRSSIEYGKLQQEIHLMVPFLREFTM